MVEPQCFSKQLEGHTVALNLSAKDADKDTVVGNGLTQTYQNCPKRHEVITNEI